MNRLFLIWIGCRAGILTRVHPVPLVARPVLLIWVFEILTIDVWDSCWTRPKAVDLNLWVGQPLTGAAYQIVYVSDIYVAIHNSSRVVVMKQP